METKSILCESRSDLGSRKAKMGRRGGRVPVVLYGGSLGNEHLWIQAEELGKALASKARVLSLSVAGKAVKALIKEIQYDSYGDHVLHLDFQRLQKGEKLEIRLPLVLKGVPQGAKTGGVLEHYVHNITLLADPDGLPTEIEFDVTPLQVGEGIKVGDLSLPAGATLMGDPEATVGAVVLPLEEKEEEAPAEEMKEPEVTGKGGPKTKEQEEE
ncbi:MAG: 50S ribosomal protein L25 [Planctomycetota bacterium]|jgi:large subunit ribosomal protein L25